MRIDIMGRPRKKLEDKSTSLMFRMDNKTIFLLCDKFNISYNREGEFLDDTARKLLIIEIERILRDIVE